MKVIRDLKGKAYDTGYSILEEKGAALIPLCPANSHFKEPVVKRLLGLASDLFGEVVLFIPDAPTIYTYAASGYSIEKATRKARLQGHKLQNIAARVFNSRSFQDKSGIGELLRWNIIHKQPEYTEELTRLIELYNNSVAFRSKVNVETMNVIGDKLKPGMDLETGIRIGIPYVLEELAWVSAAPEILGNDRLAYVYHKPWFLDDFLAGKYDHPRDNVGMVIIS